MALPIYCAKTPNVEPDDGVFYMTIGSRSGEAIEIAFTKHAFLGPYEMCRRRLLEDEDKPETVIALKR